MKWRASFLTLRLPVPMANTDLDYIAITSVLDFDIVSYISILCAIRWVKYNLKQSVCQLGWRTLYRYSACRHFPFGNSQGAFFWILLANERQFRLCILWINHFMYEENDIYLLQLESARLTCHAAFMLILFLHSWCFVVGGKKRNLWYRIHMLGIGAITCI